MTCSRLAFVTAAVVACSHIVTAQQPPRPVDSPRNVTLTLTEYNRLLDLAGRSPQPPIVAPVSSVLASADLRVRVERETATGTINLAGEVLRAGISRVNLLSGTTLIGASVDGRPIPLMADGGASTALLPGPGPFLVALDWAAPLTFAPGRASFLLPVPPAGTARATFDLPGEQADVHVSNGLVTRRSISGGRTTIEATLRPGAPTEVWWSMRDSAPVAAAREVRTLADVLTLVTLGDSDVRVAALVDVTVVQGDARTIDVQLPAGYELTSISGSSIETSEPREGRVALTVSDSTSRHHHFLVSLERQHEGGSFSLDTGFVTVGDVQRERGEIAVEGVGTFELNAAERDGMHRIDVRELNPALQSLARQPILSAFRYQRGTAAAPGLALDVKRFPDAGVLAAVADRAVATTLVTSEGRALTEVLLHVQNRAQPFLRVNLPAGATIVSVDVAGEAAKPVLGVDGTRVPLLRPGFRPSGPYEVSFVYLHAGTPFARKGELQMTLPKMDVPVGIVEWEVFVPDSYAVRAVDGNVIDRRTLEHSGRGTAESEATGVVTAIGSGVGGGTGRGSGGGIGQGVASGLGGGVYAPGQIRGRVTDKSGAPLPGVSVVLEAKDARRNSVTGADGMFVVSDVPSGEVTVTAQASGFTLQRRSFAFNRQQAQHVDLTLDVGGTTETVTATGESPVARPVSPSTNDALKSSLEPAPARPYIEPSQNVINLQRRAAGVLPVRVDVPRAGTSHQFVKPLVVDQETVVQFRYKRR